MIIKKIVTHAGNFHADDVSAVALLLHLFPNTVVHRTYEPSQEDFEDESVVVLDIGRRYEPEKLNFDHHQDPSLPSANMLILNHFYRPLYPKRADFLEKNLFRYISDVDTGVIVERMGCPPTFTSIIRAFNNTGYYAWENALNVAEKIIVAEIFTAEKAIESEKLWGKITKKGKIAINKTDEVIVGWHELANKEGIKYMISKNIRKEGSYQITTTDSSNYPLPIHPTQIFRHNSGFLASYNSLQDAIAHAETLT